MLEERFEVLCEAVATQLSDLSESLIICRILKDEKIPLIVELI